MNQNCTSFLKYKIISAATLIIIALSSIAYSESNPAQQITSCPKLRSLARIYMSFGEFNKAQPFAEKAMDLAKETAVDNKELSMCMLDLAYIYNGQGRYDEARDLYLSALKLQEQVYYSEHPYIAYTLQNLSITYKEQGNYAQAEAALEKAFSIMQVNHTPNDPAMTPFLVEKANLYLRENKLPEAEQYYLSALDLINKTYGPDHLYTANVNSGLAELYTLQGRFNDAEALIGKARQIQERIYGQEHYLVVPTWLTTARIYQAKGDKNMAEDMIQKASNAIQKKGNIAAIIKLGQKIEEIRSISTFAGKPSLIAKNVELTPAAN